MTFCGESSTSDANFACLSTEQEFDLTNGTAGVAHRAAAGRRARSQQGCTIGTRADEKGFERYSGADIFSILGDAWRAPANSLTGGSRAHRLGAASDLADHRCHRRSSAALLQRQHLELHESQHHRGDDPGRAAELRRGESEGHVPRAAAQRKLSQPKLSQRDSTPAAQLPRRHPASRPDVGGCPGVVSGGLEGTCR
jgi:hypothetical protein